MVTRILAMALVVAGMGVSTPKAVAEDLAVIIANEFYQNLPRARDRYSIVGLEQDFRDAGFRVELFSNSNSSFATDRGATLLDQMDQADRLVVLLSGHLAAANGQDWLLHTDWPRSEQGGNALNIGQYALPLAPFIEVAARRQGDAVIAIANASGQIQLGSGVRSGLENTIAPQGVTMIFGANRQVANFISRDLLFPTQSLADAAENTSRGLTVTGFLPRSRGFMEITGTGTGTPPQPDPFAVERALWQNVTARGTAEAYQDYLTRYPQGQYANQAKARLHQTIWQAVRARDTVDAYQDYLRRYPQGQFAHQANTRLAALTITPEERARQEEQSLNLNRNQRRSIQRSLTLLGFDTRGIDGVLGNNSRRAIRQWQNSIGVQTTGYLNANQITRIDAAATARAEQLRREAEERRRAEERRDRRYWNDTGAGSSESGMRAYLQRYRDGLFSQEARARLKEIERERRRQAEEKEREAWDKAVMIGTKESYLQYLNDYPNGRFVEEARARVQSLTNPETPHQIVEDARAEENSMNLNQPTLFLVEGALRRLGSDPGRVDGTINNKTRRAIRKFQRANGLDVTGYLTKKTLILVMAGVAEN